MCRASGRVRSPGRGARCGRAPSPPCCRRPPAPTPRSPRSARARRRCRSGGPALPGAGTSSRSRSPRRRGRRASTVAAASPRSKDAERAGRPRRGGAAPPGRAGTGPGHRNRRRRPRAASRSAAATAPSAASRMTVRIVPSTGFVTAQYAVFVPCDRAYARSSPLKRRLPASPSDIPRKIWLVMTPELPRAPMRAPKLMAAAMRSAGWPATASASSSAALTVATMFVPVSPSGTGNTLRPLISSVWASRLATAARNASSNPAPSQERRAISRAPSGDVRTTIGQVPDVHRRELDDRRRGQGRGLVAQAVDVDRQAVDLAFERVADPIADRRVDLARHLGDRHAVGDRQVELDLERGSERHPQPARAEPQPLADAPQEPAAEPGHPVRAERRGPDDVDDRTARHKQATGNGFGGHARGVLLVVPVPTERSVGGRLLSYRPDWAFPACHPSLSRP